MDGLTSGGYVNLSQNVHSRYGLWKLSNV